MSVGLTLPSAWSAAPATVRDGFRVPEPDDSRAMLASALSCQSGGCHRANTAAASDCAVVVPNLARCAPYRPPIVAPHGASCW